MKKDNFKTDVLFLLEKDSESEVYAYFQKEIYVNDSKVKTCYSHIGQHSACSVDYAKECKEANFNQYADLKKELESIGYNLNVLNTQKVECHRPPTKSEIKFGEGATHYKEFTIAQIGFNKKGELKSRFKCKVDNLFYSRL